MNGHSHPDERSPLLHRTSDDGEQQPKPQHVDFGEEDAEDPRQWTRRRKLTNVAVIALMALLSPLASSMFTPGLNDIARDLNSTLDNVVGAVTGYVVLLGMGPLIWAPLSETFGRRPIYIFCFTIFSLTQIPAALAPNVGTLIAARTFAGFFGSVGIANGGGTIGDMFHPSERSTVFGIYLLGPLVGPTLGPIFGGIVVQNLGWRWVFYILTALCSVNTFIGYVFLRESYGPAILAQRCKKLSGDNDGAEYTFTGQDTRHLSKKLGASLIRPLKILFTQPIVFTMAAYQAALMAVMFTQFTNMDDIFEGRPYHFNTTQIGLLFIPPGLGYLTAVRLIVPHIDTVYNRMTAKNDGVAKPEFRLPLANIGAVLLPIMILWFGWAVSYRIHWFVVILPTYFLGLGQVCIFNSVQNYYIDAFEKYAASAIAAGAVMRSVVGGVVPLFAPSLFRSLGYGWGFTVFAVIATILAPSPTLFMRYGERLRRHYEVQLD